MSVCVCVVEEERAGHGVLCLFGICTNNQHTQHFSANTSRSLPQQNRQTVQKRRYTFYCEGGRLWNRHENHFDDKWKETHSTATMTTRRKSMHSSRAIRREQEQPAEMKTMNVEWVFMMANKRRIFLSLYRNSESFLHNPRFSCFFFLREAPIYNAFTFGLFTVFIDEENVHISFLFVLIRDTSLNALIEASLFVFCYTSRLAIKWKWRI